MRSLFKRCSGNQLAALEVKPVSQHTKR